MANKEVGIKFLIWAYFNLDGSEDKKDIIKRCIELAYKDATNQGAFNAIEDKGAFKTEDASSELQKIIEKGPTSPFDDWHETVCKALMKSYTTASEANPPAFSYGNAQKWLNMTIKYLYIYRGLLDYFSSTLLSEGSREFYAFYDEKYATFENEFHIPIDSFIMEAIWGSTKRESAWVNEEKLPAKGVGAYSGTKHIPWSQFDDGVYKSVQEHVKAQLAGSAPMEWENEKWIAVAKKRKNK